MYFCLVLCIVCFVTFPVLLVCTCVLNNCHRVATQLQLNILYHMSESNWETLSQRRKISRICALFKAYSGERAWKFIGDRLQRPNYLSRIDLDWKTRNSRQRTDIGKYSFVSRTLEPVTCRNLRDSPL